MDTAFAKFAAREQSWLPHDRRGRWCVTEPGVGRLLNGSPAHVRRTADRISDRRVRRFSSLSQARAFARQVGGDVTRWHRRAPKGFVRKRATPWEWATRTDWMTTTDSFISGMGRIAS
jgi:hypothetical protein